MSSCGVSVCPVGHRDEEEEKKFIDFFLNVLKKVIILCCIYFLILYRGNFIVKLWFGCHFFLGAKLSVLLYWCQIVLVPNCPVPNCPFLLCWCQIVRVPNCQVPNCPGAKLSCNPLSLKTTLSSLNNAIFCGMI